MILLDTHIWVSWVSTLLSPRFQRIVEAHATAGLGVSVISCWEVAKKVRTGKLDLDQDLETWIPTALRYRGVRLLDLSPEIVTEANSLPGEFHRDPADQMIVATARVLDVPILTADAKILAYPHVRKVETQRA